jgi:hypothetical protein
VTFDIREKQQMDDYDNTAFCTLSIYQQLCLLSLYDKGLQKLHAKKQLLPALYLAIISELIIEEHIHVNRSLQLQFDSSDTGLLGEEDDYYVPPNEDEELNPGNAEDSFKQDSETENEYFVRRLRKYSHRCSSLNQFLNYCISSSPIPNVEAHVAMSLAKNGVVEMKSSKLFSTYRLPIINKKVKSELKGYIMDMIQNYENSKCQKQIDKRGFALLACLLLCDTILMKDIICKATTDKTLQLRYRKIVEHIIQNGNRDHPENPFYHIFASVKCL